MKTKIFIAIITVATLISCSSNKKSNQEEDVHEEDPVEGVVILNKNQQEALNLKLGNFMMRNLTTVVKTNGQLEVPPSSSADVTAIIGGNVKSIKVFHGDKVSRGQLLAVLEHPDYIILQEEFSEVANKLEYLEKEYERQKELFENNVGAGKDYQQAKSEYNTAKAKYAGLKSRLQMINLSPDKIEEGIISNTVNILSPINGFVNDINIKVGSYADAKDILFEVTDNSAIHADFMIYEKDVHLVKEGQKVHFTVSNRPDEELTATVFAIGKEFEANSRAVHIHANINEKVSGLISGMYISGHLHTDEKFTRTLPNDAIVTEGTKSYIFIQDNEALESKTNDEHDGHDHGTEEKADAHTENDEHSGHDNDSGHNNNREMAFRMVEVIIGLKDDGYTEIHLIDSLPKNTNVVMNAAYYLLADMKKEETEHDH
ncbi:MAG: efflux RND transporter periplasmic adaptor subunit [Bacteroidales bacterium]|nr:efflux RND transporter periplasmic adaptor subunit [Bacteroidales bacterium]